ncbi:hypothetical protein IPA_01000 [Ignicoccus pacificus DSM 13166]|uniref:TldD/PmbA family protein n=1 Tax=Ignicoccus pacificus DSM 13166 TaxID=940294 RepID=A0A977KAF2_9CREN|nr:hypothetical protein IPA_01000 [Ignicoccus pacificus DSM 13166]
MLEELDSIVKGLEDAEVYVSHVLEKTVEVEDNRIVGASAGETFAVALRVERDKRIGFAYSTASKERLRRVVEELYERAQKVAALSPRVDWWEGFPSSKCSQVPGLFSEEVANKDLDFLEYLLRDIIGKVPESFSLSASMSLGLNIWAIANTEGTQYEESVSDVSLGMALSKKEGGYMSKSVWDVSTSHSKVPLPEEMFERLLEEANMLKIRPERVRGERVVYLDPRAVSQLLEFLSVMFAADTIAKGESPLSDKINERVFSKLITLSDNPLLPGGPSSHGCDEEGVRGKPLVLVDNGVVKSILSDLYWGYRLGTGGGRGYRPNPFSPPSPSYTNLTLHAGSSKPEGIKVLGLTGLHTASSETGDMSVVLSPAFEDGRHVEATMSVNVLDLLNEKLLGVTSEGRWVGSTYVPGVIVRVELH